MPKNDPRLDRTASKKRESRNEQAVPREAPPAGEAKWGGGRQHTPVLLEEFLTIADPHIGDRLLDATLGLGGHAHAFLEAAPDTEVVGCDADPTALKTAKENLAGFKERVTYLNAHFSRLKNAVGGGGDSFTHVLFDLGIGSHQLADNSRGFSFQSAGPLSMRYGQVPTVPSDNEALNMLEARLGYPPDAHEIVAQLDQDALEDIIRRYGEEKYAARIAQAIRRTRPRSTSQLAETVQQAVPGRYEHGRINPATRTFQALRLAVNRELESLEAALPQALELLAVDGKLIVISFHSLEDRLVKRFFKSNTQLEVLTKKPVQATAEERSKNPRSRSAKLRAAKRAKIP